MSDADDEALPATEWEVPEARERIPDESRLLIGAPTSIIRAPRRVHDKIATNHARDLAVSERSNEKIESWEFSCKNRDRREIYLPAHESDDRAVLVIGKDKSGSCNLETFDAARARNLRNRVLIPRIWGEG